MVGYVLASTTNGYAKRRYFVKARATTSHISHDLQLVAISVRMYSFLDSHLTLTLWQLT